MPITLFSMIALPVTTLFVVLLPAARASAAEPATTAPLSAAENAYLKLGKEFRDELNKFWEQADAITDPRAAKDFHTQHDPAIEYLPKLLAFESEHAGEDVGLDALSEVASYAARGGENDSPAFKSRREMLARLSAYEDRAPMARVLHRLAMGNYDPQVIDYFRRLSESPQANPTVRATAQLELAQALLYLHAQQKNSSERLQDFAEGMPTRFPDEPELYQESLADVPPDDQLAAGRDQAFTLLESLAAAGDSLREPVYLSLDPNWLLVRIDAEKGKTSTLLAVKAAALLFKQRHLRPGQAAPDLELQLIDGKHWSLAEQHGRVVVVQFCFTGCGPCEEMYPQLRKLHERLGDQLALVTILRDDTPENGFTDASSGKITWPIACDGVPGAVCTRWAVTGFPTVYLIDDTGHIAAYDLRGEQLEWKVDKLLANKK